MRPSKFLAAIFAAVCLTLATLGDAQTYPTKPLRLINPFAAGGSADVPARFMAMKLSEVLGQPVIVENRAGAGGVIGNEYVAKQAPDGYTLLLVTGAYPVQAAMLKSLPFDPLNDISMISLLTSYPFVVNVVPSSPFNTLGDLIRYAKANPGKLSYSSAGIGSVHHFAAELFNAMAGTDLTHVPFRGGSAPLGELLSGRVDVLFEATTLSLPQIQAGKLRALAVTSRERSKLLPDVPAAHETLPGYEVTSFIGLATTGGTPPAIIERLNREIRQILESSEAAKRFIELGGEPRASTPAEMRSFMEREIAKWREVVRMRKIEPQ